MNPLKREIWVTEQAYGPKFNIYEAFVKMYSRRKLSYQSDILNAFAGVKSAIRQRFGWKFTSALPEQCFDLALLWRPMGKAKPPLSSDSANFLIPAWCWSGTSIGIPDDLTVMLEVTSNYVLTSKTLSSRMPRERGSWRPGAKGLTKGPIPSFHPKSTNLYEREPEL